LLGRCSIALLLTPSVQAQDTGGGDATSANPALRLKLAPQLDLRSRRGDEPATSFGRASSAGPAGRRPKAR